MKPIGLTINSSTTAMRLKRGWVFFDSADLPLVAPYGWYVIASGYAVARVGGKPVPMHRLLLRPPPEIGVDHRNHRGLDNRRCNLRLATQAQNSANSRTRVGRSGFKGVFRSRKNKRNPWTVMVQALGRRHFIGEFATPEIAAKAYDDASARLHGAYSYPNFQPQRQT